uniref:Ig-like domain-containing protein n=1 Tax=Haplochromis burtoni TaxID=8153 RepID=A0A3Q2W160_HAPBU
SRGTPVPMQVLLLIRNRIEVNLQHSWSQIFTGETITLRCEIQGGEGKVWKYEWTAPNTNSPPTSSEYRTSRVSVSHSGDYRCRGSSDYLFTGWSDAFTLTVSSAVLTIEPNWSSFVIQEFVTFICDMNEGEDADWEYKINKDGREFIPYNTHKDYTLEISSKGDSGEYQCSGRKKSSHKTKNSNTVSIIALEVKPKAQLTTNSRDVPVAGKVTLNCSVNLSSEWKYFWYRGNKSSEPLTTQDAAPSDGQISVSQEGLYRCRAGRGNPVYYTDYSDPVNIDKNSEILVYTFVPFVLSEHCLYTTEYYCRKQY